MSTPEPQQTDTPAPSTTLAPLVGLIVIFVAALIAAVAFSLGSSSITIYTAGLMASSSSDIALKAGLAWWSGFSLSVAATAGVGALVLAGVRVLLRRGGLSV